MNANALEVADNDFPIHTAEDKEADFLLADASMKKVQGGFQLKYCILLGKIRMGWIALNQKKLETRI